jgi:hypothetical protein
MRSAWLVALSFVVATACAAGGDGNGLQGNLPGTTPPPGPTMKTPEVDSGSPPFDSGTGPSSDDAPTMPDVGSGFDANDDMYIGTTPVDAGPEDTASPPVDSGTPDAGSCGPIIDISAGGSFSVDTCTTTSSVDASCGTTAPAAILRADAPATGSTYEITFPSGWVLQMIDATCAPALDSCGSTGTWSVSGINPGNYWYFAVAPATGVCGSTSVSVDRIM